jgi:hypothetical protein
MLSFIISYPKIIKFPYFADTTERGDRGRKQRIWDETEGDFTDNSIVKTISHNNQKQVMIV